ncbi:MAG TPA: NAD-dependent succinate-semialdehyde dehydrogenase [Hyphomicrobiaceae bacterium]|nr:NAD-dependent succinate-semialdehyde dehydrogenase [Hyphomicrobiaceae bacterium]
MDTPTITLAKSKCYVDGQWVGEPKVPVTNKATGEVMTHVPDFGEAETRAAIEAAGRAQPPWAKLLAKERSRLLRRWFDLMTQNTRELALLLTSEQGKPLAEAAGEIAYAAGFVEFFAEEAKRVYGETIPSFKADARIVVIRQPVGVVAAITPWNFPAAMITRKVAPALAVGCTVVCKPASETPLTALALAALAEEAGFPKGVFNVITGKAGTIGKELTSNPDVRMLTFTGSTEIGRILMAQCAPTIKKLGLELGGNAPFIVFDDADLDKAVQGAMASKYRNAGQTCVCANRIYVQEGVYDAFAEKLAGEVRKMKVGPGTADGVTTGPLINKAAVEKVEEHVADALRHGASVVLGGKRHALGGNFYEPTILANVTKEMMVAREETFGPVAPLFKFKSEEDVIAQANDTPFGLAAYFYARDLGRVWRVAEAIECGIIGINEGIISNEVAPFGGYKQSGLGREGSHHGIEEFLETKYMLMGGL